MLKQSRKIFNNKNRCAYFLWIFIVNNFAIWSYRKQTYFISRGRLYEKVLWIFKRIREIYNWLWKEKHAVFNKKRNKNTPRCKGMLHLWEKNLKKLTKSKDCRTVRDHGHHTGKHRSAAYSICNLRFNVLI